MDMREICKVEYVQDAVKHPYLDTDKYFHDLLTMYGFSP